MASYRMQALAASPAARTLPTGALAPGRLGFMVVGGCQRLSSGRNTNRDTGYLTGYTGGETAWRLSQSIIISYRTDREKARVA